VIDLTGKRGLSHAVPRHWEYLAAEWGGGEDPSEVIGAAHAIENAAKISQDFCLNVVAGMLDVVSCGVSWVLLLYDLSVIFCPSDVLGWPFISSATPGELLP
jgi:hypothetical protein